MKKGEIKKAKLDFELTDIYVEIPPNRKYKAHCYTKKQIKSSFLTAKKYFDKEYTFLNPNKGYWIHKGEDKIELTILQWWFFGAFDHGFSVS